MLIFWRYPFRTYPSIMVSKNNKEKKNEEDKHQSIYINILHAQHGKITYYLVCGFFFHFLYFTKDGNHRKWVLSFFIWKLIGMYIFYIRIMESRMFGVGTTYYRYMEYEKFLYFFLLWYHIVLSFNICL